MLRPFGQCCLEPTRYAAEDATRSICVFLDLACNLVVAYECVIAHSTWCVVDSRLSIDLTEMTLINCAPLTNAAQLL